MARTQAPEYEQRREDILDLAAKLFARKGFSESSMTELAAASSISKSLIYHYFDSKEDILYAVMASHIDILEGDVSRVAAMSGGPLENLAALVHRFMAHYVGAADRQKVLLNELDSLPPGKRADLIRRQRAIVNATQELVVGVYPALSSDPARARVQTLLLFGMMNWTHTWFRTDGSLQAKDVAQMILELFTPTSAPQAS